MTDLTESPDAGQEESDFFRSIHDRPEDVGARPVEIAESSWLATLAGPAHGIKPLRWRGVVDALEVPAPAFVAHGAALRERYPSLRSLIVFRLNDWGARLARCKHLRGIGEIDLACWYPDEDAAALAASPHLASVERLVVWSDEGITQGAIFARSASLPNLRELTLVAREGGPPGWSAAVDEAAGRRVGRVYDFGDELFSIAPDFDTGLVVGRFADGTQILLVREEGSATAEGVAFDPDGTPRGGIVRYTLPKKAAASVDACVAHFSRRYGFVPALIRVKQFGYLGPISRFAPGVERRWGTVDPAFADSRGNGGVVYDWVINGMFVLTIGNDLWCDRRGHITST